MNKRPPRAPLPLKDQPWCVLVRGEMVEGNGLSAYELAEYVEQHGESAADDLGPTEDYVPEFTYGPYTRRQAERIAAYLSTNAKREKVTAAVAVPMVRWVGSVAHLLEDVND